MDTALALLERGEAVVIFPEGTRHRSGPLHAPKRGVGRLALRERRARRADRRHRHRARPPGLDLPARAGGHPLRPPLTYPRVEDPSKHLANEVTARIWPCVELQWAWLGGPMPEPVEVEEPVEQRGGLSARAA